MVQKSLNMNQAEKASCIWMAGRRYPLSSLKPSSLPTFPFYSSSNLGFITYPQSCRSMVGGIAGVAPDPKQVTPDWLKQVIIIFLPLNKWLIFEWTCDSVLSDKTYKQAETLRAMLSFSQKNIQGRNIWFVPFILTDKKEYESWACRNYHTTME